MSELYACWRQQLPLLQLELAWELLFECTIESGGKKNYFFYRILTVPVTVVVVAVVVGVLRKEKNNSLSIVVVSMTAPWRRFAERKTNKVKTQTSFFRSHATTTHFCPLE